MYCAKCGVYIESGEICAQCAEAENTYNANYYGNYGGVAPTVATYTKPKSGAVAVLVKIAALVLAILTFVLQFSDLITEKKSKISESDYRNYMKRQEDEDDEEDEDDYLETDSTGVYENDDYAKGGIDYDRLSYAKQFLQWAFLAFALYLGTFAASFYSKNEKAHVIFQGIFFSIMLCAFLFVWFSTFTGKAYRSHYIGYDEYAYYTQKVGITFAWVCAFLSSAAGLVMTIVGARGLNKE